MIEEPESEARERAELWAALQEQSAEIAALEAALAESMSVKPGKTSGGHAGIPTLAALGVGGFAAAAALADTGVASATEGDQPFIGSIGLVGFNFAPTGYALCNGQLLPIAQNTALFSLLGTFYGGDGITTFALPDLRSRVPIHQGTGPSLSPYVIGQIGGTENVTLLTTEIPSHTHAPAAVSGAGNQQSPVGHLWAAEAAGVTDVYSDASPDATMASGAIGPNTGSQPHSNLQPLTTLNFIIALQGVFPSRS